MQLKEIMTRNPESVAQDNSVLEAAKLMGDLNVGFVPVTQGDAVVGVLTDRDITVRAVAEGRDPKETKIVDIMTPDVELALETAEIEDAAETMKKRQIRRIVIQNEDKKPVGVVSLGDIAVALGNKDLYATTLEHVSEPAQPRR